VSAAAADTDKGWQARLALGFRAQARRTVLAERAHHGPLSVQRPFYPEGPVCHVYLLHPPGGVVGGDRLAIDVDAGIGSQALITTPGATKFYRSASAVASQCQRLRVRTGASLEWFPQENILFPGAEVSLATHIELEDDARLAFWEIHCLGRPVIDEPFDAGRLDSRLAVYRDGRPLLLERLRVAGQRGTRRAQLAGHPVTATLLLARADTADRDLARSLLPELGDGYTGITLIEDLLVVRYLGRSTEQARGLLGAVWSALRPAMLGIEAAMPRIWAT
jgi:urease accessory protein